MKLTAILLATLLEASKATVVSYTDGGGVRQDVAVSDVNKPGLAGLLYAVFSSATANLRGAESYAVHDEADPLNSFDNLLATNGNQGYCQPWGNGGGDLCKEEKTLDVCSGYDGAYYLRYNSAEVARKCLEEPKCKGFTWDTELGKGKLKSTVNSVNDSNSRWQCFKKQEVCDDSCSSADGWPACKDVDYAALVPCGSCNGRNSCIGNVYTNGDPPFSANTDGSLSLGKGSCNGYRACYGASTEASVGDGSCTDTDGDGACYNIGEYKATTEIGNKSCRGQISCYDLNGIVGDGSCVGGSACGPLNGNVGDGSCVGEFACYDAKDGINIGIGSCVGDYACSGRTTDVPDGQCTTAGSCCEDPNGWGWCP